MITGTVRRDGFSGFGKNRKIAVFPSIALGWVLSEESFMMNSSDVLNYMKIRASYGQPGKRRVGRYDTHAKISTSLDAEEEHAQGIIFGDGGSVTNMQWISSMANYDLGWETTTGLNIGADFAMFNSRLHGNIEYYNNHTNDILYSIKIPNMTGFSSIDTNIGEVANHGLEFTVNGTVIKSKDFSWDASLNYSRNRNEIVSILGKDDDGDGIEDDLVQNSLFIGHPTDLYYDFEIIGMWQLSDAEEGIIPDGFLPGEYKLADLSGPDGVKMERLHLYMIEKLLDIEIQLIGWGLKTLLDTKDLDCVSLSIPYKEERIIIMVLMRFLIIRNWKGFHIRTGRLVDGTTGCLKIPMAIFVG